MRVTLIHNPSAGDGQPGESTMKRLIREAGHELVYQSCREAGWESALESPGDLVAVAGGDGTLGRIAKYMSGRGVPIAALPLGTANNLSKTLGAKDLSIEQIIETWSEARRLSFDVGTVTGPWGRSRFIESVGVGLFTRMMARADASEGMAQLTSADDKLVYALQMLKDRLKDSLAVRLTAELDGRDISGDYLMLEAMNIPFVGPNLYLAPHGDPTDGCLDVSLINEEERSGLFSCLGGWQRGTLCRPELPTHSGRHLKIEWTGFPVHIDDEIWPKEGEPAPPPRGTIDIGIGAEKVEFLEPGLPVGS